MMLVEEGKIGLSDKLSQDIPDSPKGWHELTVPHLLTHTTGLRAEFMPTQNGEWLADYTTVELFEAAIKLPFDSAPGERYS